MDIFHQIWSSYGDFVADLPRPVFIAVLRAPLIIGLPGLVCGLMFRHLRGRVPDGVVLLINWTITLLGGFEIMGLRLDHVPFGRNDSAFAFTVACIGIAALPWAVSYFLATRVGYRRIVAAVFYVVISTSLVIQIFAVRTT